MQVQELLQCKLSNKQGRVMYPRICGEKGIVLKWKKLSLEFLARDVCCWKHTGLITASVTPPWLVQSRAGLGADL